jgi:hypothetical protein
MIDVALGLVCGGGLAGLGWITAGSIYQYFVLERPSRLARNQSEQQLQKELKEHLVRSCRSAADRLKPPTNV